LIHRQQCQRRTGRNNHDGGRRSSASQSGGGHDRAGDGPDRLHLDRRATGYVVVVTSGRQSRPEQLRQLRRADPATSYRHHRQHRGRRYGFGRRNVTLYQGQQCSGALVGTTTTAAEVRTATIWRAATYSCRSRSDSYTQTGGTAVRCRRQKMRE